MKKESKFFAAMQKFGGSMMLPISILPASGLLLGIGYGLCNAQLLAMFPFMATGFPAMLSKLLIAVSGAIFNNLPAIFAVGVAVGLSDDGACGLAGLISLFVMNMTINFQLNITDKAMAANPNMYTTSLGVNTLQTGVFGGILCAILAYQMYVHFKDAKIPQYLGFFGGKRLIPIVSTIGAVILGIVMSLVWPLIQNGIVGVASQFLSSNNPSLLAVFIYGFVFKLLGVFGLHHLVYPIYYYQLGTYKALDGTTVVGDWNIYFRQLADGVPVTSGACMSGSFVIYMIGLLGIAFAIYKCARPENKTKTAGMMITCALASTVTGITEPLEYSFAYTCFPLYFVHSILNGLGYMICPALGIHCGTSFSGGLIDYILCSVVPGAPRWWLIIPVGIVFAVVYYVLFSFLIKKFNFETPGREVESTDVDASVVEDELPYEIIRAFGGVSNLENVGACFTRLRVTVKDPSIINEKRFKELGAQGVVKNGTGIQVIIGTQASQLKDQVNDIIASGAMAGEKTQDVKVKKQMKSPMNGKLLPLEKVPDQIFAEKTLGEGFAIDPTDGLIVAPVNGTITQVSDTLHAIGLETENGENMIIHVGIDTCKLNGKGFKSFIKAGDKVKEGEKLIQVDLDDVKKKVPSMISPIILLDHTEVIKVQEKEVQRGEIIEY